MHSLLQHSLQEQSVHSLQQRTGSLLQAQVQLRAVGMLVERWESWGSRFEEVLVAFGALAQQKRSQLGMKQQMDVGRMVEQTQDER